MIEQTFKDIYDEELAKDAIINDRMEGFREDYLTIHCLLRRYKPKTFMEVGTHTGMGAMVIKNALGENSTLYSLDLPDEDHYLSKQHPISEGKKIGVGSECTLPFIQLRGNSIRYDCPFPKCEGYYFDGEHDWGHVFIESTRAVVNDAKIIIWHDADLMEVEEGIRYAMERTANYDLCRVTDTRIMYAIEKYI